MSCKPIEVDSLQLMFRLLQKVTSLRTWSINHTNFWSLACFSLSLILCQLELLGTISTWKNSYHSMEPLLQKQTAGSKKHVDNSTWQVI